MANEAQSALQRARQANVLARQLVTGSAVKRTQQIYSRSVDVASENIIQIQPRYAGLLLGFYVTVQANIAVPGGGAPLTKTPFGPLNLINQIKFDDLNNNTRIQTTGWHMGLVNSARAGAPYLGCRTNTAYPVDFGRGFNSLMNAPVTIAAGANADVASTYFVPLSYSQQDLRGSIYLGVVNATAQLQLTLNSSPARARTQANGSDAVYVTAAAGTAPDAVISNYTVEVWQCYYDSLPQSDNGLVLPMMDLATIYDIKNTSFTGITPNQDFPMPYSNFRDFLSTIVVYRNDVAASGVQPFADESDINKFKLESANYTNIWEVEPRIAGAWARQTVEDDFPLGVYYFPSREKPVSTVQQGNFQLVMNAADVQPNAALLVGYESFALTNQIANAGSLPAAA